MKPFLLSVLALCLCAGCAQRYKVTLRNHQEIITSSRPKFDKPTSTYRFKDGSGKVIAIPVFRIREIEPL